MPFSRNIGAPAAARGGSGPGADGASKAMENILTCNNMLDGGAAGKEAANLFAKALSGASGANLGANKFLPKIEITGMSSSATGLTRPATANGLAGGDMTKGLAGGDMTKGLAGGDMTKGLAGGNMTKGFAGGDMTKGLAGGDMTKGLAGGDMTKGLAGGDMTKGLAGGDMTKSLAGGDMTKGLAGGDMASGASKLMHGLTDMCSKLADPVGFLNAIFEFLKIVFSSMETAATQLGEGVMQQIEQYNTASEVALESTKHLSN